MVEVFIAINATEALVYTLVLALASIILVKSRRYMVFFLKSLVVFDLIYITVSIALQVYTDRIVDLGSIVLVTLRVSSIAVLSTLILTSVFNKVTAILQCREGMRMVSISLNTLIAIAPVYRELAESIRINYGYGRSLKDRVREVKTTLTTAPAVVVFIVINLYEHFTTMTPPTTKCKTKNPQ